MDGVIGTIPQPPVLNATGTGENDRVALPAQAADFGGAVPTSTRVAGAPSPWNRLRGVNNCVGCVPPESLAIQKQGSGFVIAKQQNNLLPLKVLFGDKDSESQYTAGDTLWIEHADTSQEYLKRTFDIGHGPFILVPMSRIRLHRRSSLSDFF